MEFKFKVKISDGSKTVTVDMEQYKDDYEDELKMNLQLAQRFITATENLRNRDELIEWITNYKDEDEYEIIMYIIGRYIVAQAQPPNA